MKKKTRRNFIMVALIAVILACGIVGAVLLRPEEKPVTLDGTSATVPEGSGEQVCTVEIRCDTVLDHMDKLNTAKAPYIPADGMILLKTQVRFTEGESAFDVLQRLCEQGDIQLEYSWTPIYDSYYVEGISHLYEFDCGAESGWMYKVNGIFPNYGCSSYEVKAGDEIVWCYTCQGLGTDVGAERMN